MDFYRIKYQTLKNGYREVYPDFQVTRISDLMVRGKSFYAVWDETKGMWSTDEYDVQRLVDDDLQRWVNEHGTENTVVKWMGDFSSNSWLKFRNYMAHLSDTSHQLDERLTFKDEKVNKNDYRSKRLPYALSNEHPRAFLELVSELYDPSELAKLEWSIGSIVAGDSIDIQKFVVLYGSAGTGKSTVLNVVQSLFEGYYTTFEAKALSGANNAFSTEVFRGNPMVAIQHDGDLSRIEDNTKLNSIISHEEMTLNEKFKPTYTSRINAFLFMGTNRPVKITDAKSGIIRRLIDVKPSGRRLDSPKYQALMGQIQFELGAIAQHCLNRYREMGKTYYDTYRPVEMMLQTDVFYNYIESYFETFRTNDGVSLKQAYAMYKEYCDDSLVDFKLPQYKFREELKNYFRSFDESKVVNGQRIRSYYSGFKTDKFKIQTEESSPLPLVIDKPTSLLDDILKDCPAQYANDAGAPKRRWVDVTTTLKDLDTTRLHYVKVPPNHIVIDFDLRNEKGEKDAQRNLEAASKWPPTYAEYSKSGAGIHLHYNYTGDDLGKLAPEFADGIEIKVYSGDSALRRVRIASNGVPVSNISTGLPLKEKKMINSEVMTSEKSIRKLIERNLHKEIHPGTKPSMDFIKKILDDAYASGMTYDVSDLRPRIMAFAMGSSHQADYCLKLITQMKFVSEEETDNTGDAEGDLVYFDCEVFPNLFLLNWKKAGDHEVVRMINPTPNDVESLAKMRLVGFNNRKYDNHILYARMLGYNNDELYHLSKRIIENDHSAVFREAYNLSYADVYDYSNKKQSLKKWEIELGIPHKELDLPWDQPVDPALWPKVAEYCDNDVIATEAVANNRKEDFVARSILAGLSGLTVNDTTQRQAARIIFGNDRHPQSKFVYTFLSERFPGYEYSFGKSSYRGEDPGEGGYVYSEPGIYRNVALLDVASMHPTSIECLNLFGQYTENFSRIKAGRIAVKHGDLERASELLGTDITEYIKDSGDQDNLAYALKIVINSVYGLTSAKFDNPFRDPRNVDNIVAKRGALFMIDLKHAVQEKGFTVAHIKTDSIKIPDATPEIIQFVMDFGKQYGYTFEHEATYDRMCLVNDAVYIAHDNTKTEHNGWTATGAQFQHPFVFKTLFSGEEIEFKDLCEAKTVTTALYLDMNEPLPEGEHDYHFVGRAGEFTPVKAGEGGGILLRIKEDKYYAASGTKGYRWMESDMVKSLDKTDAIDLSYFESLANDAVNNINNYGDYATFVNESGLRALDQRD